MIDVQRLRILREVARHGSFSRAAAALLLTPSAVSQQIAALERTLGTPVVHRSTRGAVLTEPGRLLVEAAETISAELRHTQEQIDRFTTGRATLTVATFTSGGRYLLPAALARFTADHPEVELTVLEHEPEGSLPMIREGRADIALAYHFDSPPPVRPGDRSRLTWTPLMEDPMSVVVPAGHRLAGRASVDLAEIVAERWVLGCLKTGDFLHRYATLAGSELRVSASTTDYFFAQVLVAAGVGIAMIPEVALRPSAELVAVPVGPPRPARYIGVAVARRRLTRPHVAALAEALRLAVPGGAVHCGG
ncbi:MULTISPECIES: LysR family transcriptional regulator [Streptosporangium]|uniref:Molybdate transport repressor ModE-like protein n=1 Tax=Streptosporangium brasiliense TaxID=47480 RepID=A0ABT9R5Q6_9ACTN|nr:LysR family transcriptional regulator [Streptosporangium brasiliense]MDP9864201.1 molybdate transport repressor ModE-like protein [Streptosporangium brasiliense]